MTDDTRYGWQVIHDPTTESRLVGIVDGDIEDALAYVEDERHLTVGNQVKLIDGDLVGVTDD